MKIQQGMTVGAHHLPHSEESDSEYGSDGEYANEGRFKPIVDFSAALERPATTHADNEKKETGKIEANLFPVSPLIRSAVYR